MFGLVADGFFNSPEEIAQSAVIEGFDIIPGDVKYKDLNGDGVVNQYGPYCNRRRQTIIVLWSDCRFQLRGIRFSCNVPGNLQSRYVLGGKHAYGWLPGLRTKLWSGLYTHD